MASETVDPFDSLLHLILFRAVLSELHLNMQMRAKYEEWSKRVDLGTIGTLGYRADAPIRGIVHYFGI